ncbi:hypothetical protein [Alistipes sp. UBA1686]|uniref:hypothetical protein n=1 Tax=Alistipes sp. UBA1686 TaxID=1946007 RepID=UPI0025799CE8|nr:hypothetical protein [Alistipes sp. UBA1686]
MKTGLEMIAERQSKLLVSSGWLGDIGRMIIRAEMLIEFQTRPSQKDEAIRLLAEAGARIATEIDRINKLSTK